MTASKDSDLLSKPNQTRVSSDEYSPVEFTRRHSPLNGTYYFKVTALKGAAFYSASVLVTRA